MVCCIAQLSTNGQFGRGVGRPFQLTVALWMGIQVSTFHEAAAHECHRWDVRNVHRADGGAP